MGLLNWMSIGFDKHLIRDSLSKQSHVSSSERHKPGILPSVRAYYVCSRADDGILRHTPRYAPCQIHSCPFALTVLLVTALIFMCPARGQQISPEQVSRIKHWIIDLSSKDNSKRILAEAQLGEALKKRPVGPVAVLLRHANVVDDKQATRRKCRQLLMAQHNGKREDARKLAADTLGLPIRRIIDIPFLPYVLNKTFLFAVFNPSSRIAGPTAKGYVSVSFPATEAQPVVRSHKGGVSPDELFQLLAASDFRIESAEDALDLAVFTAALASTDHADGWCLVPHPDTVAPCDRWPQGSTLPLEMRQKAVKLTVTLHDKESYVVSFTTWAAVGGRVTNWRIQIGTNRRVKIEHHEVIGGAFGIGFS